MYVYIHYTTTAPRVWVPNVIQGFCHQQYGPLVAFNPLKASRRSLIWIGINGSMPNGPRNTVF